MRVQSGEPVYVEITYRGIFQKRLAKYIAEGIVYTAREMGKPALSFGRYGDSPERNGVPAKYYVGIGNGISEEDLIGYSTRVEPDLVDSIIVVDDTLLKGVESWAWQGVQPINLKLKENGTMIVTSNRRLDELAKMVPKKNFDWTLGVVKGDTSFSGLWVFKDDLTMEKIWGALARLRPDIIDLEHLVKFVSEKKTNPEKRISAIKEAYSSVDYRRIMRGEGIDFPYNPPRLLTWQEMLDGAVVPAVPRGGRNEQFKRGTTKSERPTVNFDTCIKCKLCWIYCPDECFDETPDGYYDIAYDYCVGCGICAEVCPVKDCIVMVDEKMFTDYRRPYGMWKENKVKYKDWLNQVRQARKERVYVPGLGR
ncbi:(4Fe-4S)-binding protein [Sulfolobus acidocaldarius SUSAZ]|nr:(4Fe-4S)-binding protein [Sulfolobus acidocaldarius SUSAZ]